jgi:uncharacterized protein (TIGR02118 family)
MYKFMIMFRTPEDHDVFEGGYQDLLALVERMPDIERRQVVHIVGSPLGDPSYYRILEAYFPDRPTMEASLRSPAGQEAGAEMGRFPAESFEMAFAEVYEEAGGKTPQSAESEGSES